MHQVAATLFLSLFAFAASAADVYKCKGKSGETLYSEYPCDAASQPMKLRDTRPASAAIPVAETTAEEGTPAAEPTAGVSEARSAERACAASATASIYGPSNDRIAGHQQQLVALSQQLAGTGANSAADGGQHIRARMTALRQSITREHANAHAQMTTARQRCAQQHRSAAATPAT